jgi:hypothetical protein
MFVDDVGRQLAEFGDFLRAGFAVIEDACLFPKPSGVTSRVVNMMCA